MYGINTLGIDYCIYTCHLEHQDYCCLIVHGRNSMHVERQLRGT